MDSEEPARANMSSDALRPASLRGDISVARPVRTSGGLGRERLQDLGRDVPAATTVGDEGGDGPDGTPGDSPPAEQERDQGEGRALSECALVPLDEVDVGRPLEREDHDRDAILEDHEPAASLDLVLQLVAGHVLDPPDLHRVLAD